LRIVKTPGDLSWGDMGAYLIMEGENVIHVIHHVVRDRKVAAADWKETLDDVEGFLLIAGEKTRR
jgi:hypothetical protein